jgi:hypothetical protein
VLSLSVELIAKAASVAKELPSIAEQIVNNMAARARAWGGVIRIVCESFELNC